jgi:formylglycine-generating enzyme required for sulfatase activity
VHKRFCIDRYEWPNQAGAKPLVAMDWNEARTECEGAKKRLCADSEWTLACEGQERLPYPYGYVRNAEACNIDKPYIMPDDAKWANPHTRPEEIARLDQRDPSGARESCVSPYGVHDMTGNVDEWVTNEKGKEKEKPYVSGLKGGYWGPVRDRCRPMTTDHNQWHTGYQIGFRCCEDVPSAPASTEPSSVPAPTPAVPART